MSFRRGRARLVQLAAVVAIAVVATPAAGDSVAGKAGTDTSLPSTDSAVTISGRGPFKEVKISVNQTEHLLNQAISVDWTGAPATRSAPGRFGANYMQLMQCWGDDDGTHPDNPGPPPEQCVAGAKSSALGPAQLFPPFTYAMDRIIGQTNWANFDPKIGFVEQKTGFVWRSFRAVDGTVVNSHLNPDFNPDIQGGVSWTDPYFDVVTSNEIAAARTGTDGKGSELFEVTTGVESSGLGCGQQVEKTSDGGKRIPKCWLVVVPRGTPADENLGSPFGGKNADSFGVVTSPLAPAQWANRIAIPLEFNPVDSTCSLGADQRQIIGSELAAPAVSSWQPKLCETPGLEPYAYGTLNDGSARQQLVLAPPGAPGLVVVSRPVDQSQLDPASPVVYAPLTLSGTVIAFNVERNPKLTSPADEQALAGVRVAQLNLTPRLIAKLLTQSYTQQVNIGGPAPYDWLKDNPANMGLDPDFLQFNPEFAQLSITFGKNFGGFVMPATNSDAARQLWDYVLADPEAKAWLDGAADPWKMKVNPVYATSASANPSGIAFADPVPSSFPKSDSYCYQGPKAGLNKDLTPSSLCSTDWLPYTENLRDAARLTRAADDRAKIAVDTLALSVDQIWKRDLPQTLGSRSILSLSDSASAVQYGVQTARVSRAGDDKDDRSFIAPDAKGFTAAVDAMKPLSEQAVLEPDPTATTTGAYPLTVLTYGAIKPLGLDQTARDAYAAFLEYAAGKGQTPGQLIGQLPEGYAPLPAALKTQATTAAKSVRDMVAPATADETSASTEADSSASGASPSASDESSGSGTPTGSSLQTSMPDEFTSGSALSAVPQVAAPAAVTKPVKRGITPIVVAAITRFVLPILGAVALLAALGVLEITKRPRRALGAGAGTGQAPVEPGAPSPEEPST